MNKSVAEALSILQSDSLHTIAILNGDCVVTSEDRGIKFLLELVERDDKVLCGATVADKVVGRAAALLMAKGGVKELYAEVLSVPAEQILKENGIQYEYETLTQFIINRKGDGQCPMESAVLGIDNPDEAVKALRAKLNQMYSK